MKKNELTSKNLQRLAEKAGLGLKSLKMLYKGKNGKPSPATVYQHWTGRRALGFSAGEKYIQIFKGFGLSVSHEDFYKE